MEDSSGGGKPKGRNDVLHNIPKGMTAWEASREFSDAIGEVPDLSVVSLEHFIYMVSDQQTLYVSDELFKGYDPESGAHEAWDSSKRLSNKKSTECPTRKLLMPNQITNTYSPSDKDKRIVQMAEKALGGVPQEGMRNNFLLNMTIMLSYHYGRNPKLLKTIIPHYGQNEMEFNSTIESGCRPEYHNVHYMQIMRGITESMQGVCANTLYPEMPEFEHLPSSIKAIISGTPEEAQSALAIGAFSALGSHLHNVKFTYSNKRDSEPAFMNLLIAEFGSGIGIFVV